MAYWNHQQDPNSCRFKSKTYYTTTCLSHTQNQKTSIDDTPTTTAPPPTESKKKLKKKDSNKKKEKSDVQRVQSFSSEKPLLSSIKTLKDNAAEIAA